MVERETNSNTYRSPYYYQTAHSRFFEDPSISLRHQDDWDQAQLDSAKQC